MNSRKILFTKDSLEMLLDAFGYKVDEGGNIKDSKNKAVLNINGEKATLNNVGGIGRRQKGTQDVCFYGNDIASLLTLVDKES